MTQAQVNRHIVKAFSRTGLERFRAYRQQRGVTQLGRVLGLGPRCRRFEPCHLDHLFYFIVLLDKIIAK